MLLLRRTNMKRFYDKHVEYTTVIEIDDFHYGLGVSASFIVDYDVDPGEPGDYFSPPIPTHACNVNARMVGVEMFDQEGQSLAISLNETERMEIVKLCEKKYGFEEMANEHMLANDSLAH
jgi:hypothetical protein